MVKMIAGELEPDQGWCTMEASVSYKPQHVTSDFEGNVQLWLDVEIGAKWRSGEFHTQVISLFRLTKYWIWRHPDYLGRITGRQYCNLPGERSRSLSSG